MASEQLSLAAGRAREAREFVKAGGFDGPENTETHIDLQQRHIERRYRLSVAAATVVASLAFAQRGAE